jgi:predicted TIM-barrel fold metal-dependent hydrolase
VRAAQVRASLKHPIVDGDGHWTESLPVLLEYVRDAAGTKAVDDYQRNRLRRHQWYSATREERQQRRLKRYGWWVHPTDTQQRATIMLPGLLHERLGELGIDFAVVYPTLGLGLAGQESDELRVGGARAYNTMAAEFFAAYSDNLTPAAVIPTKTPAEAVAELNHAVKQLGLKTIVLAGCVRRSIETDPLTGYYFDSLGLDSPYDYDPLWQACVDNRVAVTAHGDSHGWPARSSTTNMVFNHIGHFADNNHVFARAVFLGGITSRFPTLNFAFLEGGAGWGVNLLTDLIGHWEKRNPEVMREYLRPTRTDLRQLRALIGQYAPPRMKAYVEETLNNLDAVNTGSPEETEARELVHTDDFEHIAVSSKSELAELYARNFYFGCEADDPVTSWAFDGRMPARLKAILGSDIGHWDAPDLAAVIPEAFAMVERGLLNDGDFRDFAFTNSILLHGRMNPAFFDGTTVEKQAREVLEGPRGMYDEGGTQR